MTDERTTTHRVPDGTGEHSTDEGRAFSRRSMMAGMGGLAGASLVPIERARAASVEADAHTRQTYRSIAAAGVPRTPDAGGVEALGALDVDLEQYIIYNVDFGHTFVDQTYAGSGWRQRLRERWLSRLADKWERKLEAAWGSDWHDKLERKLETKLRERTDGPTADGEAADYEVDLSAETDALAALARQLAAANGIDLEAILGVAPSQVFGSLAGLKVAILPSGHALSIVLSDADRDGTAEPSIEIRETVPLATMYAAALDLYAIVYVLGMKQQGRSVGPIKPRRQFLGGGFFTFLAPEDRLRCLLLVATQPESIGPLVDVLLPDAETATTVTGQVLTSNVFGYYTEWPGYGDTGLDDPTDRELEQPMAEIQGWRQIGYAGPQNGYAGFTPDWPVESFRENDY
ncbi:MAG: hypothetical protein ABEJ31_08660 [Haloarculaceae archaeon]